MKKKIVTLLFVMTIALSSTACGFSRSVVKSDTGMISESVTNNSVKLNLIEHTFPEDCAIETAKLTSPVGMSVAQITQKDTIIGVLSDGYYSEDITEDNILDVANIVLKEVNNLEDDIATLTQDCVTKTKHLNIVSVRLTDGNGYFIAKLGTNNFAYVSQSDKDNDDTMGDVLKNVIKTLGEQEDFEALNAKSKESTDEKETTEKVITEETSSENLSTKDYYVTFEEGNYPIAIPNSWETDQFEVSFFTRASNNIEVSYRDSCVKLDNTDELNNYYESLTSVYAGMTPVTLTIPCNDGTTITAYAFTSVEDGYTKTKILEPVKLDNNKFLKDYLEIEITDFTGEVDFASQDIDTFTTYVSQFLCIF